MVKKIGACTMMAFIAESDDELFDMEVAFLARNFSGGIEICVPEDFAGSAAATMRFKEFAELKNLSNFHYALVKYQKEKQIGRAHV